MFKTPVLTPSKTLDMSSVQSIKFRYDGQNQVIRNNLVTELLDGTEVYNQTQNTFSFTHTIAENVLTNGNSYRMKIRVGDVNNNWSSFSESVIVYALDNPSIVVTSIDEQGKVYNQTVLFEATYSHPNNEPLQSYKYYLYDNNQALLTVFPDKFSDGSVPITQEITGLANGDLYYVQIGITTPKGQEFHTEKIPFTPFYISPNITGVLKVDNVEEQGAVRVSIQAKQVVFRLYNELGNEIPLGDIEYVGGDKLDLNRVDYKRLTTNLDDGFKIDKENFYCQIWVEDVIENEVIFKLYSPFGWLELKYYGDRFHVFKHCYDNNLVGHFASNEIVINGQVTVGIRQINNLIDVLVREVG